MKFIIRALMLGALLSFNSIAQEVMLDRVAVIVDQGVVLESEIEALVQEVKRNAEANGQQLPSDRALRTQAIERLITKSLQLQMAERMGIQISDPQLEQTIGNIAASQNATIEQLRESIALQGIAYEDYREDIREEIIMGEVRRANVRRRVYITPQEINTLIELMEQQGAEQAEYRLGHILIGFPTEPTDEDIQAARERADKVIALLESGSDFAKIAIASSSGNEALEGGDMGWMNINAMPTLFAEAIQGKDKDVLVGPIRSGAGFHILKVLDTRGIEKITVEEVNSRHILVKPSIILSEDKAKSMLIRFREEVESGESDFAELAKEYSEDPGSALRGGELGWSDPENYTPAFKEALAQLEPGEFSDPVRSTFGWHLIQLIDRRVDDATDKRKEEKASQLIFNRKFAEETENWLREMRDAAYVEVVDS
ncbi:peptidylprolyl isomerase SurA [Alteromonas sp. McT4-15]|jgi:peptidyl-prolyl cis-trans isomerase SurA|nr:MULTISPECIES: peptidylprolyl isomerase SurA [unclassified Alteromonas]MCB4436068.1 peptidylprolyl isomerase SurA [Alteromonas sp. McT4-15]GFD88440.1 chaperone SurA [Tenacibaculum sp. KUL152]WDT86818.1 peptidylprolyl isomerase SurA [Alteromonas sp. 009811495]BCO17813.1 chaperone SurA [Alteromonas sp. KC3]BCO21774.1 chaperone SurA [Alteromonas sp. KC14]